MLVKGSHSVSSVLLLAMVEDSALDLHPILSNILPSVSKLHVLVLFATYIFGLLLYCLLLESKEK